MNALERLRNRIIKALGGHVYSLSFPELLTEVRSGPCVSVVASKTLSKWQREAYLESLKEDDEMKSYLQKDLAWCLAKKLLSEDLIEFSNDEFVDELKLIAKIVVVPPKEET